MSKPAETFVVVPKYQPLLQRLGIAAAADVFSTSHARVWRSIAERDNATIDPPDGPRLHLKRDKVQLPRSKSAVAEAAGIVTLHSLNLPTANLVAHGSTADGRTFAITEDLAEYQPADAAIRAGVPFDLLLQPLAAVAGAMHRNQLFHRDMYLCHFMLRVSDQSIDVRMIDLARLVVRPFFAARWQLKDLAQLVYSMHDLPITAAQVDDFFALYSQAVGKRVSSSMRRMIDMKVGRIARHDAELHRVQPGRDVTLGH